MSGFPILDLVIGMIFIFFLLSIICSSAVELWFSIRRTRARLLEQWLKRIFDAQALDPRGVPMIDANNNPVSLGKAIMDHCMTTALSEKGTAPTYINTENFISSLLDKITLAPAVPGAAVQLPPADLDGYINAIQNSTVLSGELKRTILILAHEAKKAADAISAIPVTAHITHTISGPIKSELDHFRERLGQWYDKNAERLSGEFKRKKVLPLTFIIAVIITVLMNADSVAIGKYLYQNREVSQQLADQAMITVARYNDRIEEMKTNVDTSVQNDSAAISRLNENVMQLQQDIKYLKDSTATSLPLGWKNGRVALGHSKKHLIGWLASILAICLGAPFWFDILNKIANLRGSGPKPATVKDERN